MRRFDQSAVAVYRRLLLVYPRDFRARFAQDLCDAFLDARRSTLRRRGLKGLPGLWFATLLDVVVQGVLERLRVDRRLRRGPLRDPHRKRRLRREAQLMESVVQDIRFAVRTLIRTPGFTAVVILTLALGIGANTAIFSVVNGVVLRPLSLERPEELTMLWETNRRSGSRTNTVAPLNFEDWRDQSTLFSGMAATRGWGPTLSGMGDAERLVGAYVSPNMFTVLDVGPVSGRLFIQDDANPASPDAVIISHRLWQRLFGGDHDVVGRALQLNGGGRTIVGILPRDFRYPIDPQVEIWSRLALEPDMHTRGLHFLRVVGRLMPGVTLDRAQAEMTEIGRRLEEAYPVSNTEAGVYVVSLHETIVGNVSQALFLLLGAVGFVLLIAAVNVANLFLARASARGGEIAVRAALGASRGRIARQMLTESLVLAALGGGLGVALAVWGVSALVSVIPPDIPRLDEVGVDGTVLRFSLGITALTGLFFGLFPAAHAARAQLIETIKAGGRDGQRSRTGLRVRRGLVVSQVAIALVLLVGSGLLIKSFGTLLDQDLGFQAEGVLSARVTLNVGYDDPEDYEQFYTALLERLEARRETETVGAVLLAPFSGNDITSSFAVAGRPEPAPGQSPYGRLLTADHRYFRTTGMSLLAGRPFTAEDRRGSVPVAIVNQAAADRWWPDEDPIGQRLVLGITLAYPEEEREVVGIVSNAKYAELQQDAEPQIYVPYRQLPVSLMYIMVRTVGSPAAFIPLLRQEVRLLDPNVVITNIDTLDGMVSESVASNRFYMVLLSVFAGAALLLGALGVYGVLSYGVVQRTGEMGIRIALGARAYDLLRLIASEGIKLVGAGIGIGLLAAFGLSRLMDSLLYGVSATDPVTFLVTGGFLAVVALVASYLPARRAGRVNPVNALRRE